LLISLGRLLHAFTEGFGAVAYNAVD